MAWSGAPPRLLPSAFQPVISDWLIMQNIHLYSQAVVGSGEANTSYKRNYPNFVRGVMLWRRMLMAWGTAVYEVCILPAVWFPTGSIVKIWVLRLYIPRSCMLMGRWPKSCLIKDTCLPLYKTTYWTLTFGLRDFQVLQVRVPGLGLNECVTRFCYRCSIALLLCWRNCYEQCTVLYRL